MIYLIAAILIIVGLAAVVVGVLGPWFGLGYGKDFIPYQLYGVTRHMVRKAGWWTAGMGVFLIVFRYLVVRGLVQKVWLVMRGLVQKAWLVARGLVQKVWARAISNPIRALLDLRGGEILKLLAINLVVFAICAIGIETLVRVVVPEQGIYVYSQAQPGLQAQPGQYFKFQPYTLTSNEGPLNHKGVWRDALHNVDIPYEVRANSLGFRIDRELDTTSLYEKASNEGVVLIFGGSAVYGFGNTSNETTIAGWLQKRLNTLQNDVRYTVFNMGNGGWVSYQEFIAWNLYGTNLRPDWVIFMDGRNDIFTLAALIGDDVGFHFVTPTIRDYIDGYLYRQSRPDFFRGEWENDLIRFSATYRWLTGKRPIERHQSTRFPAVRDWSYVEKTVDFYLRTQMSVLRQCADCNFILSTQPIYRHGRKRMSAEERAVAREKYWNLRFGSEFWGTSKFEDALQYSYGRIVDEMPRLCAGHGPRCHYKAMDDIFPSDDSRKRAYFVDDVHLTDEGNRLIAEYYASVILGRP